MGNPWTVGAVVEWANGRLSIVAEAVGASGAVLRHPSGAYMAALGDPSGDWTCPAPNEADTPDMATSRAFVLLAEWEAEEVAGAKPCPDLLGWMRGCRADLLARGAAAPSLAEVEAFADHMARFAAETAPASPPYRQPA